MLYSEIFNKSNLEVAKFFNANILKLDVVVHDSKSSLDESWRGHNQGGHIKPAPWMVGFTAKFHVINILSPSVMPRTKMLTGPKRFAKTLKHDIAHVYLGHINSNISKWFNEGLALCIAEQKIYDEIDISKIKTADLRKLDYGPALKATYQTGWNIVAYIINQFGKDEAVRLASLSEPDFYREIDNNIN